MQLLLVALGAWFVAQLVKFSIRAFGGDPDFRLFYQSGGMPSAHSATVVALATAALTTQGYQSPIFGLSVVIAAIVIYDSLGVRRSSGEQSIMINALLKATGKSALVKEILGHTPKEVAAGSALGLLVGLMGTFNHWSDQAAWLTQSPGEFERYVYMGLFIAIVAAGIGLRIWLRRYRAVEVVSQLASVAWNAFVLVGSFGLLASLLQFQTGRAGSWRLWAVIVIVSFVVTHIVLSWRFYPLVRQRYEEQSAALARFRKQQRQQEKKVRKSKSRRRTKK